MSNDALHLLIKEYVGEIIEMAEDVKNNQHNGSFSDGQLLAYNSVLSRLKIILTPNEGDFGLDFDIDKKLL